MAQEFTNKSYDYVIVGGGTAGLVIAARLTEDPNVTVGVIEAGGNRIGDPLIDGPALYTQTWDKPEYDWMFKTVPQKGTLNRVHGWARGKVLGGSSAINYNMFSMASRQDLDNWVELGNQGWGFDDLAPYYRKFETFNPPSETVAAKFNSKYIDPRLRGTNGPIQISFCESDFQWQQEVWPPTCINGGWPEPQDPRTGSAIGGFNQLTTVDPKTSSRSYAARDYYEVNKERPNLSVLTNALVSKIDFDKGGNNATATGVQFIAEDGSTHTVKAAKEVIVCGGVINSPQILELSGIGSATLLRENGIDVVVDNPNVGENLNDHSATGISISVKDEYPTAEALLRNPELTEQAFQAYLTHKAGPLTNAPTTCGFVPLSTVDPELAEPKEHIKSMIAKFQKANPNADPAGRAPLLGKQLLDDKESVGQIVLLPVGADIQNCHTPSKLFIHDEPGNWITMGVASVRSFSRGSVHIASSDPKQHPVIDPAYYSHPLDLDLAGRSILHALNLAKCEPLKSKLKLDANGELIVHPAWSKGWPKSLEEAKELAAANTVTEYHPVGTCNMVPKEKGGVVDSQLKVYGTNNVRVADASIFPTHVQGNIVSLVYAVAEKAADVIKGKTAN